MTKAQLEPVSKAAIPQLTQIQIVCGDCGGLGLFPKHTLLTDAGTCSRCGGTSYVLAAKISGAIVRHLQQQQGENK